MLLSEVLYRQRPYPTFVKNHLGILEQSAHDLANLLWSLFHGLIVRDKPGISMSSSNQISAISLAEVCWSSLFRSTLIGFRWKWYRRLQGNRRGSRQIDQAVQFAGHLEVPARRQEERPVLYT